MVLGYQRNGGPDGFLSYYFLKRLINVPYVDGVSITYSYPTKHLWTYAIGHSNLGGGDGSCPCSQIPGTVPPLFVHDN